MQKVIERGVVNMEYQKQFITKDVAFTFSIMKIVKDKIHFYKKVNKEIVLIAVCTNKKIKIGIILDVTEDYKIAQFEYCEYNECVGYIEKVEEK